MLKPWHMVPFVLVACSPAAQPDEKAAEYANDAAMAPAAEAAAVPIYLLPPPPPPPPPFRDCTQGESDLIARAAHRHVSEKNNCVANYAGMAGSTTLCQYENATGYVHGEAAVTFYDTFTEANYRADVSVVTSPVGTVMSNPRVSVNQAYRDACAFGDFLDALASE